MQSSGDPRRRVSAAARSDPRAAIAALGFSAMDFRRQLSAWYTANARKLPWRGVTDPYAIWLSEIMLQQTRVATVIDRYRIFLYRFPTIRYLAAADEADVLALWSGLGYYRRARLLHRAAQFVERELSGRLPRTAVELRRLPGVGEYTAAAIASIAFGEHIAVLDGNVERVLLRLSGEAEVPSDPARQRLLALAQLLMPPGPVTTEPATPEPVTPTPDTPEAVAPAFIAPEIIMPALLKRSSNTAGDHNQAMMELGATICLPRAPLCAACPVHDMCKTRGEHPTPRRERMRSENVSHLLALRKCGVTTEVLLHRRPSDASLMPGMLELPPLSSDATLEREPVIRLRHAITNTNYYVKIFSESVLLAPVLSNVAEGDSELEPVTPSGPRAVEAPADSLLHHIAVSAETLAWAPSGRLPSLPITGLARKALQRLRLMPLVAVKLHTDA